MSERQKSELELEAIKQLTYQLLSAEKAENLVNAIRNEGIAHGYDAARQNMQASLDEATREFGEIVWNSCADAAGERANDLKALNPWTIEAQEERRQSWEP